MHGPPHRKRPPSLHESLSFGVRDVAVEAAGRVTTWIARSIVAHDHRQRCRIRGALPSALRLAVRARNATLNYRRREKLEERATHSDEGTIALFTRTQLEIEREVALAEFERAVKRAIAQLPQRCGEVYALSREQYLSYAEIGDVLGISPKTVEVHMGRAFKLLRKHLAPYLQDM